MAELELQLLDGGTVAVRGEIDMATVPQFRAFLDDLVNSGSSEIRLDCRELAFLDSSGIGVLVAVRQRLGADGVLSIEGAPSHVRRVLEITGVDSHLSVVP